jgi:hypothetical protein
MRRLSLILILAACGCHSGERRSPGEAPEPLQASVSSDAPSSLRGGGPRSADAAPGGLIWMFPGIEGSKLFLSAARMALRDAGFKGDIRTFSWGRVFGGLNNLVKLDENRAKAAETAAEIARFRRENPEATIDLIGYSGGGGIAVFVAEALPAEACIRHLILCQPALSPRYDLTAALRHVDGKLVNFHCLSDDVTLGWGTRTFGTIDRRFVVSAGNCGFELEYAVQDEALRSRVEQKCWESEAFWTGHYGGHAGIITYGWNRKYVAPYLVGGRSGTGDVEKAAK